VVRLSDPEMSLDNWQIAKRHLAAFVIQEYAAISRVPASGSGGALSARLFEVLGAFPLSEARTPHEPG